MAKKHVSRAYRDVERVIKLAWIASLLRLSPSSSLLYVSLRLVKLKVVYTVLEFGRDHDECHFAADFAKVVCATQNAETRLGPDLGQRGDAAKNNLALLLKHCGYKTLEECGLYFRRL